MHLSGLVLVVSASTAAAAVPEGWFPFFLAGGDGSLGSAGIESLNEAPAGRHGFVSVRDGRFVDGRGRRIRFFATNLTATACFPAPAEAPKLARRLRALGFNLVRLHFMDIDAPSGIFVPGSTVFDSSQVDRLDRLVAALKAEGIYVNMNLHVARRYPGIAGEAAKRFGMSKVLDRFYPEFIEAHHRYARDLLGHVNPYTKSSYAREPAVALVELNNENTLLPFWGGSLHDLPEPFAGELARQWRAWLARRYGTTEKIREAWRGGERAEGPELLRNAGLAKGTAEWRAEAAGGADARLSAVRGDGGARVLRWEARKSGTESWNLQLMQSGLAFEEGRLYELSFRARCAGSLKVAVTAMLAEAPWSGLGLDRSADTGPEWKRFSFRWKASGSGGPRARINLSTNNATGTIEIADISLREAAVTGLADGETIGTAVPRHGEGTPAAALDWWTFLVETERATTAGLVRLLKEELGVRVPIADTQADYGGAAGLLRETALCDYIDTHAYWEHPEFPGGAWDPENWRIGNSSQVRASWGGVLADLALARVAGMPFAVSEYNVPNPNDHAAETLPMLAAIAGLQDWDAVYPYTYLDFSNEWAADHLIGFFSFAGHAGKLVFAPAAAAAFRLGLVASGREPVVLDLPRDGAARLLSEGRSGVRGLWDSSGVAGGAVSVRRLAVRIAPDGAPVRASASVHLDSVRTSDTGEIVWEPGDKSNSFRVAAPAFRMAAGTIRGTRFDLGDLGVEVGGGPVPYACLAAVALDAKPLARSKRVLVSVAGRVENQGMGWNGDRTSIGNRWGEGPAIAERIPVTLSLPGKGWKAAVLDGAGNPSAKLEVSASAGGSRVSLNAPGSPPSLWFLLTR